MNYEMANPDKPEELIAAAQASLLSAMEEVINKIKIDVGGHGLNWKQLEFLIEEFKKKKPTVIFQNQEQ